MCDSTQPVSKPASMTFEETPSPRPTPYTARVTAGSAVDRMEPQAASGARARSAGAGGGAGRGRGAAGAAAGAGRAPAGETQAAVPAPKAASRTTAAFTAVRRVGIASSSGEVGK